MANDPGVDFQAFSAIFSSERLKADLRNPEHSFVERKSRSAAHEWLQVAVAFANSTPIGFPALLFVGCDDAGSMQCESREIESLQKQIAATLAKAYPEIAYKLFPLHEDSRSCVAVVVQGSPHRPHFAGSAYVRQGPEVLNKIRQDSKVLPASQQQLDLLVAERSSKVYALRKWIGKPVWALEYVRGLNSPKHHNGTLVECNLHYLVLALNDSHDLKAFPLSRVQFTSIDADRLDLEISDR